eukprot:TRINITY_DN1059_c0_g1_i1.p1 TRINITY_DN1059_c0_g1~~TRINITY_DN1059_c0_g1_i1.p1  ORF type:complete len:439 (-),score=98.32 TRINITY_DN1059_c0_g1_i1:187-1503(-)
MGNKQGKGDKNPSTPKQDKKSTKKGNDRSTPSTPTAQAQAVNTPTKTAVPKAEPAKKTGGDNVPPKATTDGKIEVGELVPMEEMGPTWRDKDLYAKDGSRVGKADFDIVSLIGKGSFGKVFLVKKKGGADGGNQVYAMKVLRKEAIFARKQVAHTKAEKTILAKIQHPFIIRLHWAFQTDQKLYMILDFINGGELFFHLKNEGRFPEERVRLYAAEIASALSHLHSLDIVYRDLKPENILLNNDGHIVITDFGLSKEINPTEGTQTFCGTPEYLAPEVLRGEGHGTPVDWWSLGTLMYEMLTGLPPFYSQNINIMYQKILSGELRFPSYVSPDAQSILEGLLTRDPEKRLGSRDKQASDVMSHPFFKSINWNKLMNKEIEPSFKPKVKSDACLDNIDKVFTSEKAIDSVVEDSQIGDAVNGGHFDNFTYVGSSMMSGQ